MNEEEIIIKQGELEYALSEKRIRELTSQFIEECGNDARLHNDFGKNVKVVQLLVDIKKAFFPATQKTINADVQDFDKQLEKWFELQKQMLEEKKKGDVIYEITGPAK